MKKPSIRDVAEMAGVSTATVSHVLNGTRFVAGETAKKVCDSIEALQYKPNITARGFRTGKTNTVGFILPDISNHFFSSLVETVENTLSDRGYHLILATTREKLQLELEHLQYFSAGIADGIILASTATDGSAIADVLPSGYPLAFVDRHPDNLLWDSLSITSEQAIFEAVNYLCKKGHKKIGFLSGLPTISTSIERLNAYKTALKQNGLDFNEDMVSVGNSVVEATKAGTENLLNLGCTAIVVCNGLMTYEAQQYLWDNNQSAEKIDIVGFKDDYRLAAGSAFISQPIDELGVRTAEQILYRIEHPSAPIKEIVLNSMFVY